MCFWIGVDQLHPCLFVEANVKGDNECKSHTLCHHFCMHKLPSRNCISDLPFNFKVGEELVSLLMAHVICFQFHKPLQFVSLYDGQEVFVWVWSDCLLDLGADFLVGNMVFV